MQHVIEERMDLLRREIQGVRHYLNHLETIARDLGEKLEQVLQRDQVIEELLEWMGKDYKYRDMSEAERRQFDLIAAHLTMLVNEKQVKLRDVGAG